jgi:hypothetical protein
MGLETRLAFFGVFGIRTKLCQVILAIAVFRLIAERGGNLRLVSIWGNGSASLLLGLKISAIAGHHPNAKNSRGLFIHEPSSKQADYEQD